MEIFNLTPFSVERFAGLDGDGYEQLTVVVKATFDLAPKLVPSAVQPPVALADEYLGDPAQTSLRCASEGAAFKRATDIVVTGAVCAPGGGSAADVAVELRLGKVQKAFRARGNRRWEGRPGAYAPSPPEPFRTMPLVYERAYGGVDDSLQPSEFVVDNPIGLGFRRQGSKRPIAGSPLPNFEYAANSLQRPDDRGRPVGLGPVPPHWLPRRSFTGTMDARWLSDRAPLLPTDFDERFHQVAPPDQIYPGYVVGGEQVAIMGMRPEGRLQFELPRERPTISVRLGNRVQELAAPCDMAAVDCAEMRLHLIWRAGMRVQGMIPLLKWIRIGRG